MWGRRISKPGLGAPRFEERRDLKSARLAERELGGDGRPREFLARRGAGPGAAYDSDIGNATIGCAPEGER